MKRARKGNGGMFTERRARVKKQKFKLTAREVHTARETGAHLGNIHSRSISRQLKAQRSRAQGVK